MSRHKKPSEEKALKLVIPVEGSNTAALSAEPSPHLGKEAKEQWKVHWPVLQAAREMDRPLFAQMCELAAQRIRLREKIEACDGEDENGAPSKFYIALAKIDTQYMKAIIELGGSPKARARKARMTARDGIQDHELVQRKLADADSTGMLD